MFINIFINTFLNYYCLFLFSFRKYANYEEERNSHNPDKPFLFL